MPKFCVLLRYLSNFSKEFHKIRQDFLVCFKNLTHEKRIKLCKFLYAAQLILHVTDKLTILPGILIEKKQIKFIASNSDSQ